MQDECELAKSQNSILEKTKKELETQINLLIHQKEEMRQSLQEVKNAKLEEFQVSLISFCLAFDGNAHFSS